MTELHRPSVASDKLPFISGNSPNKLSAFLQKKNITASLNAELKKFFIAEILRDSD